MLVLVVSDIHGNLAAFEAVLRDAGRFDMIWSLGDIVGYGPCPNDCIERLNDYQHIAVPGNHDYGVLGRLDLADFNPDAREANLWSREQLSPESRSYLEALPEVATQDAFTLAHGSPRHPIWEYLFYPFEATASFAFFSTSVCLVGHTHVPRIFQYALPDKPCQVLTIPEEKAVQLDSFRYIINPGSVGQPRDRDPRAAYLLLDTEELVFQHRRVAYDVEAMQQLMRDSGLPPRQALRLEVGW
jgi:predicted phosphodiesterase